MLAFKAFIYRFSAIFGMRVYLAKKEEREYMKNVSKRGNRFHYDLAVGMWQADNGFTTLWVRDRSFFGKLWARTKHAFDFGD